MDERVALVSELSEIGGLFQVALERNGQGFTCITTPFLLPDGTVLDLYYKMVDGEYLLTDLGETLRWLRDQWIGDGLPAAIYNVMPGICQAYGVKMSVTVLTIRTPPVTVAATLLSLAQAALQLADLRFALLMETKTVCIPEIRFHSESDE